MRITIETIPHEQQRYPTVGDWQFVESDHLVIRVSDMENNDYAFLVGIHEAIEAWLAVKRCGPEVEKDLDAFDMQYEKDRKNGDDSEPGDDARCPVYLEHQVATGIERILAGLLGVDWNTYDQGVNDL
jgi:hypothetical protein